MLDEECEKKPQREPAGLLVTGTWSVNALIIPSVAMNTALDLRR